MQETKNLPAKVKNYNRVTVPPRNVEKAVKQIGLQSVADKLGYTEQGIKNMLRRGECPKAVELAAQTLLFSGKTELLMVRIPKEQIETATTLLIALGAKVRRFTEDE